MKSVIDLLRNKCKFETTSHVKNSLLIIKIFVWKWKKRSRRNGKFQQNKNIAGNSVILDKITFLPRRADALVTLSELYLATIKDSPSGPSTSNLSSTKAADRCQLVLHVRSGDDFKQYVNLDGRCLLPVAVGRLSVSWLLWIPLRWGASYKALGRWRWD